MRSLLSVLLFTPLLMQAQQPARTIILKNPYPDQYRIRAIREKKGRLIIIPAKTKWLTMGGNYTFSAAAGSANTAPSDGPLLQTPAPDNNSIFRTGHLIGQSLSLQANIIRSNWQRLWTFSLKAATNAETLIIPDNLNTSHSISMSAERYLDKFSIAGSYSCFSSHFSYDNSNGFLNRAYQNALYQTDNPWFPLKDNGHFADRMQQTGNLSLQKKQGYLTLGVITTLDAIGDNSNLSLKPGTAFFPAGLIYTRRQNDDHYSSNAWLAYNFPYHHNAFSSTAKINYIYNDENVNISYPSDLYAYHRSASDAALTFNTIYNGYDFTAGLNAGNKFYGSNTSLHNNFFLPGFSGFIAPNNLFDYHLNARIVASYTAFCSEIPINHTLSGFMLTQLTPQEAFQYIPTTEPGTFSHLSPMQHREFASSIQLDLDRIISIHGDFSIRNTKDNVFPTYDNNKLVLKNIADTRYKGFELQLQFNSKKNNPKALSISNSISFYKFSNIVTRVQQGYNGRPIAGFSTVYKALVQGQPVGVIMAPPSIIGNPTPDYTLKFSHTATWKAWSFNIDWEYRKGGDIWNGTTATLDHPVPFNDGGESYIQKGDNIRIHTLSLAYDLKIKKCLQRIRLTAYAHNLLVWSAYKGADPNQLLYDQPGSDGLDFFNLPSTKTYGISAAIQF